MLIKGQCCRFILAWVKVAMEGTPGFSDDDEYLKPMNTFTTQARGPPLSSYQLSTSEDLMPRNITTHQTQGLALSMYLWPTSKAQGLPLSTYQQPTSTTQARGPPPLNTLDCNHKNPIARDKRAAASPPARPRRSESNAEFILLQTTGSSISFTSVT